MTEKEKSIAPNAEKNTEAEAQDIPVEVGPQSIDDILASIDPAKLKTAEKLGFPIESLLNYMRFQEAKINAIAQALPNQEQIQEAMQNAMQNFYAQQVAQARANPQLQGGGGFQIPWQLIFGGGGGGDEEINKLTKEILRESLASMKQRATLLDSFMSAITSRIASNVAGKVVEGVI